MIDRKNWQQRVEDMRASVSSRRPQTSEAELIKITQDALALEAVTASSAWNKYVHMLQAETEKQATLISQLTAQLLSLSMWEYDQLIRTKAAILAAHEAVAALRYAIGLPAKIMEAAHAADKALANDA